MKIFENDKLLAQAIINDDELAFKTFFDKYKVSLMGYVLTLTKNRDHAMDIVQKSFVSIWSRRKTLQPVGFKQLLFTTAKNHYIDHYRSTVNRANLYAELTYNALSDEKEDTEYLQKKLDKLQKTIESLPERCQNILKMTKLEGLTQQEVADYLGISVRTVDAQVRIAYKKIRDAFDTDDSIVLFLLLKSFHKDRSRILL